MFCSTQVGIPPTGISRVAQLHPLSHLIRELLSSPSRSMRGGMGQAQGTATVDVIRSLLQLGPGLHALPLPGHLGSPLARPALMHSPMLLPAIHHIHAPAMWLPLRGVHLVLHEGLAATRG